ncbi:DNA repair protein [[Clostridium] sordellii]|uniref:ImmA/IrrE family metallo-endopeptidase n=2 Tax=Paraclostridium sordellii TaxID=1505 RepID=A0ABM9RTU7_PARSO|nr:LPD25 domain-containing protein [Paeniclostridium sordellii]CEJ75504.1 hypothetical protein ATCC9714PCS11_00451 (plasmid) [[Clostridium] sordellii] [Paeniclostridium sordellii]CEN22461.1 DNA repair protein [[Clostridium] sordellii] [Paeniclostridium sordellii]CEN29734.1 DNA repair protein [[Clostridium] sordellii] [Paeniclostridium sordellii]
MKINTELIKKTLNDYKKDILDICTSDNITIDTLSTKIESIKDNVNTFSTLSLFIDDPTFVKETTALSLISERLIENQFDFFENKDFKSSLSDSLCNMGIDLNTDPTPSNDNLNNYIVDNDINKEIQNTVDNNSNPVESEINLNNKNEVKDKKELSKSLNDLTPKEKVDLLVETANDTISSYFQSPEDMKKYLDFMSKFYKYSPRNIALIENQFMVAKAVGSFKFWKDNGFTVNKGEKGIKILVPTKVKYIILDDENIKQLKYATKEEKEKVKKGILQTIEKQYYKTGYVFEISQTNATEKDLPKLFPNKWLDGEVKDYDKMYKAMEKIADTIGVKIIEPIEEMGVAKGYSLPETKEVALNPRNSQLQNVKTLLHELAHAKLHNIETRNNYSKQEREYQAEMIAYTTCSYFDIDTSDYSFDYIYNWTKNMDFDESIKIIEEVKKTSTEYIQIIEDYLNDEPSMDMSSNDDEKEKEKNITENIDINEVENHKSKDNLLLNIDNIYVKFTSSKSNTIEKDDIYDFDTANELVRVLNEKYSYLKTPMQTNFELHIDENCSNPFYSGSIELGNENEYDLKSNLDRITNKDTIYVKFLWSENINIQENSIFEFNKANELLEILTKLHLAEKIPGYDKTKFELHFNKECTDKFYTGRFDIGDGEYNNLKEYLYDNSCNSTKEILSERLGIKDKKKNQSINKDIDMDFEL